MTDEGKKSQEQQPQTPPKEVEKPKRTPPVTKPETPIKSKRISEMDHSKIDKGNTTLPD